MEYLEIKLPASKSISNRVLLLNALSYSPYDPNNLSDCDDTRALLNVLDSNDRHFDVGGAGTAMRFLTAFLAKTMGEWTLTGSERMKKRPIKVLVDALNAIGGKIEYMGEEGFPPLRIFGSALQGGELELDGGVSSQYISALMMIAPYMEKGLHLTLTGEIVSKDYLYMTQELMEQFGIKVHMALPQIDIEPQDYRPIPYTIESDWSAASYWYETLCVRGSGELFLPYLRKDSLQGDSKVALIFERLGVTTIYKKNGVLLSANGHYPKKEFVYNFIGQPDLAQSVVVACCLRNIPFRFSGLQTLKIKETDRIAALINECKKLGYVLTESEEGLLAWDGTRTDCAYEQGIDTYDDHRMAMAFTPAQLVYEHLTINHPEVVSKSYPQFWEHWKQYTTLKP